MIVKLWWYGHFFCRTGAEAGVAGYINQTVNGIGAIAPTRTRSKVYGHDDAVICVNRPKRTAEIQMEIDCRFGYNAENEMGWLVGCSVMK